MTAGSGYVVGIDLGTTFTAAAVATAGRADIVSLGHTAAVVPSVVLVRADGEVLVGEAAERRSATEPTRVGREFKRRLGDPVPLVLGGTPYGAEALTAHLLRSVYDRVIEQQGAAPDAVVITHPANYGDYKLDLLREAVRLADVADVQFLTEPEAAATHYGEQDRLAPGDVVAVYDFGGGTFDAAVLRVGDGDRAGFQILGTPEGMDRLGGIDFDQAVYAHVMTMLGEAADDLDPGDPATASALARLREECRDAKEALSSDTDVDVPVLLPNVHTEVRITRAEFEAMIRPRIAETIDSLNRAIRSAGIQPGDVTKVLLVGGSSRIPLVAEMVGAATGRPVAIDAHPKHAIAAGAALHAWRGLEPDAGADGAGGFAPPAAGAVAAGTVAAGAGLAGAGLASAATASGDGDSGDGSTGGASPGDGATDDGGDGEPARKRRGLLVAAVVAVVALVAAGFVVLTGGDDGDTADDIAGAEPAPTATTAATAATASTTAATETTEAADVIVTAGEVILEPFTDDGADPFTDSVAAEPSAELVAFAATGGASDDTGDGTVPEGTTGGATTLVSRLGTEPGLYGGTRDEGSCDPVLLVEVLAQRPAEAAAWAGVHEIEVDAIVDYVSLLTPLVLTADTRVTNHGFVDGLAVPRQAVLQVGTAVLVDEFGVPRVRCSSGSPLLPPEAVQGTTTYRGQAWDTFAPERTVAVAAAPEPQSEFVVFDVVTFDEFVRPVGSTGSADRAVLPGEVLAEGEFTSFPDYSGPFDVNSIRMIFRPAGGPVEATFEFAVTVQGITVAGSGDLVGTFDPATNTMSGTGFGEVTAGGVAGGSDSGGWSATVDPATGTITGSAGDSDGTVTFTLTFAPY